MSAELELAVEAEVVESLDQAAASRIDQRIRLLVGTINDNIVKLRERGGARSPGHQSRRVDIGSRAYSSAPPRGG